MNGARNALLTARLKARAAAQTPSPRTMEGFARIAGIARIVDEVGGVGVLDPTGLGRRRSGMVTMARVVL